MLTIEVLGPYAFTAHVRRSVVYEHPRGAAMQYVALRDGPLDLRAYVARFRELCPNAAFQLEVITGRTPTILPFLEPEFWKAFPNANAAEFARFVALAKKGRPVEGKMVIAEGGNMPPEFQAAMKAQQRYDLERSLTYAAKVLGVGIRGGPYASSAPRYRAWLKYSRSLVVYFLLHAGRRVGSAVGRAFNCSFRLAAFLPSASIAFSACIAT